MLETRCIEALLKMLIIIWKILNALSTSGNIQCTQRTQTKPVLSLMLIEFAKLPTQAY